MQQLSEGEIHMRKTVLALGTSLFVLVVTAIPALADSSLPGPHVQGNSGTGGTAFTGAAHLTPVVVAFAVLVVVGFASLALQRRHSTAS
jgi:hypothetical protein